MLHFEELWEKCEQIHQASKSEDTMAAMMDELAMKINLYKIIESKTEVPAADLAKAKSHTMGEILFTLTKLSLKENLNVFESLGLAYQSHSNEIKNLIPPNLRIPGR
jgi:hypothetical protein